MPAYNTTRILAGNVDADAALELVTVQDNVLYVLSASGNVEHTTDIAVAGQVSSFVSLLADVDSDGVLEIGVGYNRGDSNYGDHTARLYRADGTLVQTFTKAGQFDGVMWPVEAIGGDVIMVSSAGFSRDPRGFSRWNVVSGTELWLYDVGPRSNGPHAFLDYDQDGKLEMAFGNFTPHNGGSGNGTSDGDNATIIIDEDGTSELTQKYSGTQNGTLQDVFVKLDGASTYSMVSFKGFSNSYRGNSKIHVRSLDGAIQHTASGADNAGWSYGWADLDGDGKVEIVATNARVAANEVRIYNAELQVQHTYTAAEHTVQALADIDGDGFVEVVLASRADASVIALSHTLEEEWRWDAPSNAPVHAAIVADLDGNNLLDVAVLTDDQVVILEGQAGGSDLLVHYPLDGNANNASGTGNNGTVVGATPAVDRFGEAGRAYQFDGDGYIRVDGFDADLGDFTLSAWLRADNLPDTYRMPLALHSGGGGINKGDRVVGMIYTGHQDIPRFSGVLTLTDGEESPGVQTQGFAPERWHHAVFIREGGTQTLYLNGVEVATLSGSDQRYQIANGYFEIGAPNFWQGGWTQNGRADAKWVGQIDDVRLYSRALDATEVRALCEADGWQGCGADGFLAYYPLDGDATDASANGNDGVVVGATPAEDRFGNANAALRFDGENDRVEFGDVDWGDIDPEETVTFSMWFDPSERTDIEAGTLLAKFRETPGWDARWWINYNYEFSRIAIQLQDGTSQDENTYIPVDLDGWTHLAVVLIRPAETLSVFVNGRRKLEQATTKLGPYTNENPVSAGALGRAPNATDWIHHFRGVLDDIRLYDRALGEPEVMELCEANGWQGCGGGGQGPAASIPITIADANANSRVLTFGMAPNATDGVDQGLDLVAPPPPPSGTFDARFIGPTDHLFADFRSDQQDTHTWTVAYAPSTGADSVTVTWNPDNLPQEGAYRVTDAVTGNLFMLDIRADSSVAVSYTHLTLPTICSV